MPADDLRQDVMWYSSLNYRMAEIELNAAT